MHEADDRCVVAEADSVAVAVAMAVVGAHRSCMPALSPLSPPAPQHATLCLGLEASNLEHSAG